MHRKKKNGRHSLYTVCNTERLRWFGLVLLMRFMREPWTISIICVPVNYHAQIEQRIELSVIHSFSVNGSIPDTISFLSEYVCLDCSWMFNYIILRNTKRKRINEILWAKEEKKLIRNFSNGIDAPYSFQCEFALEFILFHFMRDGYTYTGVHQPSVLSTDSLSSHSCFSLKDSSFNLFGNWFCLFIWIFHQNLRFKCVRTMNESELFNWIQAIGKTNRCKCIMHNLHELVQTIDAFLFFVLLFCHFYLNFILNFIFFFVCVVYLRSKIVYKIVSHSTIKSSKCCRNYGGKFFFSHINAIYLRQLVNQAQT